eukprot:g17813.t1
MRDQPNLDHYAPSRPTKTTESGLPAQPAKFFCQIRLFGNPTTSKRPFPSLFFCSISNASNENELQLRPASQCREKVTCAGFGREKVETDRNLRHLHNFFS